MTDTTGGTPSRANVSTGQRSEPLDDARFPPGRIFAGRYRIVSLLGRGAMGEVYRADDLRLGQTVALKLMSEAMASRHDGLRRLTDEVRLARTIVHLNVCRVYDIGHGDGWHYLSMEYVDGETLASLLRRIGQPSRAKGLELARLVMFAVPLFAAALSPVDVTFGIVFTVLGLTVLLRIGLLAHVAALMVMHSLTWMPLTLDADAWYFGWSLLVLLAIAAFAGYGFVTALGGQPAFGSLEKAVVD